MLYAHIRKSGFKQPFAVVLFRVGVPIIVNIEENKAERYRSRRR